ncbi:hypothetical protein QVH35_05100 [Candidatus Nitrosotenuis chungbukensis]|uniref:hypothetical protein n=1 Tax=Candidatus Nitrosotenuis chungbukensis TaxID=1353246 RepID=UPI0006947209|nr:hypothetical protein [Candidatus Nitrosotenuis chungbukensis]WKT58724.1 hypothetical protein QVH35_05100 [Candidatus Nitrosotenuis chungbukensis]
MNPKLIAGMIVCIIIATIIVVVVFTSPKLEKTEPKDPLENWNRSGPFAINAFQYKLGENIFVTVNGLAPNDVGKIIFGLPNGTTVYSTVPFDGAVKSEFNTYFTPSLSKAKKICSVNDIVGEWFVVFRDTEYKPITFRIINETIPGSATSFERVC